MNQGGQCIHWSIFLIQESHKSSTNVYNFAILLCDGLINLETSFSSLVEFLEKASGLNRLQLYPQLLQRAERVGFTIVRVSYRGYNAGDRLQVSGAEGLRPRGGGSSVSLPCI